MATVKQYQDNKDKQQQAYDFFISRGRTPIEAAGIVGNLVHESNLSTSAIGDKNLKDNAFGIAQWRKDRVERLKSMYGDKWSDFNSQLSFVDWELNNTHKQAGELLKTAKNPMQAGQIVSDLYERPKKKFYEDMNRQKAVSDVYRNLVDSNYSNRLTIQEQIKQAGDIIRKTNINYNFTNFSVPNNSSNFVNSTQTEDVEEEQPTKTVEQTPTEEEKILQQKQKVKNFFEKYKTEEPKQEDVVQEQPQQTNEFQPLDEQYAQVSNFVDTPVFQEGGSFIENLSKIAIKDNQGQYNHPNKITEINSPNITMKDVNYPLLGISKETGEQKVMLPNLNYFFDNTKNVIEVPLWKNNNI